MKRAAVNRPLKLFYITLAEMAGYKKSPRLKAGARLSGR